MRTSAQFYTAFNCPHQREAGDAPYTLLVGINLPAAVQEDSQLRLRLRRRRLYCKFDQERGVSIQNQKRMPLIGRRVICSITADNGINTMSNSAPPGSPPVCPCPYSDRRTTLNSGHNEFSAVIHNYQ